MAYKNLFKNVVNNGVTFKNAIVMAPMTRSRAIDWLPNDLIATYYAQRATAGLIVTEGTAPSPDGLGYARTPGIYSKEQIEGWRRVTAAVHGKGGKIFLQLMHVGRVSHLANKPTGSRTLAPSAVAAEGDMWTDASGLQKKDQPLEMTYTDIQHTIADFVSASTNAIEAGFDGVELHGANGYLLEQFLNPHTNKRVDAYGGTIENRLRFVVEVTKAVVNAIGADKVGVRVSPYSVFNDMGLYPEVSETYAALARGLASLNILYLHLVDYAARSSDEGRQLIKTIRNDFKNLLILNGGYNRERAEEALAADGADMVSFGSPFIANPDLPYRLEHGVALAAPDQNTFYTPGEAGYTDYTLAEEQVAV